MKQSEASEGPAQPAGSRRRNIGLCLSGGGYRATLFHLGSLRRLNETGMLSQLDTIASVSGGSITNNTYGGTYWGVGTDIADYETSLPGYRGEKLGEISSIRTDLNRFTEREQLLLMNHGWALTKAALVRYFPAAPNPEGIPPSRALLEGKSAASAGR